MEIENNTLFSKKNYEVAIIISLTVSHMPPINCVFDPGAGPHLLQEDLVKPYWLPLIRPCRKSRLKCATNQKVEDVRTITLHVQSGDSRLRVMFGIFRNLAVATVLGTSFIEKCITGIFPIDQKIVLFSSTPVTVLVVLEVTSEGITEQLTETVFSVFTLQEQEPSLVCAARTVNLQPFSVTAAVAACSSIGLVQFNACVGFEQHNPWKVV